MSTRLEVRAKIVSDLRRLMELALAQGDACIDDANVLLDALVLMRRLEARVELDEPITPEERLAASNDSST